MKITGKHLPKSWEKQTYFLLSNGWEACLEFGFYGEYVKSLEKDGKRWQASNGRPPELGAAHYNEVFKTDEYVDLPEFAEDWRENKNGLVRPEFDKVWN